MGAPGRAGPTGDAAYRAVISTELMENDPDLKLLLETPDMNVWMGPRRHLVGYCIRAKRAYNLVMMHPDDGSVESWTAVGCAEELRAYFADFDPRVRKLLSCVKTALRWRLMDRKPLETWIHPGGRLVLLGDACHPMLPYRAQGAAMAIEDAAVLGSLLSRLSSLSILPMLLHVYEDLRKERTSKTQASSRNNQHVFHLPDGPEQQARDAKMRERRDIELRRMRAETQRGCNALGTGLSGSAERLVETDAYYSDQYTYDADEIVEQ